MGYGRFSHGPRRYGRAARSSTETILAGLIKDFGTAFDPTADVDGVNVSWIEALAWARAIDSVWSSVRRLRNQFDPLRMTDFLGRWESIFRIVPLPTETLLDRRIEIGRRFRLIGLGATQQALADFLTEIMPDLDPALVHTTSLEAIAHVTAGADIPGGIWVPADGLWSSSIAHIGIELTRPTTMPSPSLDAEYFEEAGRLNKYLDDFLPAWTSFSAFRASPNPFFGFYLDDAENLDNEAFGIVSAGLVTVNGGPVTQQIFPYSRVVGSTGSTSTRHVYANFYGFVLSGGPTALTIALSVGTASDTWGVLRLGADPYTGTSAVPFHSSVSLGAVPDGIYTLEVSANVASTVGVSPGTVTIEITSP